MAALTSRASIAMNVRISLRARPGKVAPRSHLGQLGQAPLRLLQPLRGRGPAEPPLQRPRDALQDLDPGVPLVLRLHHDPRSAGTIRPGQHLFDGGRVRTPLPAVAPVLGPDLVPLGPIRRALLESAELLRAGDVKPEL